MSAVRLKVVRKKLVHEAVLGKIDREHLSINTDKVRARLQTNREHVQGEILLRYLDRRERINANSDIDTLRKRAVLVDLRINSDPLAKQPVSNHPDMG